MKRSNYTINIFIFLFGSLLFFPFLGSVHLFDWDEINFAECAREMIVSKNYLFPTINYKPFWEKPPLFIWMQALSMNIFGVSEFSARFPNAICGITTLLVLFNIGKKTKGVNFGVLWVLVYAGSFFPHFYFKSGLIDPWFNLFIFLGIYFFILHSYEGTTRVVSRQDNKRVLLSAFFIGLGILTKGPVAFIIYLLCILTYWVFSHFKKMLSLSQLVLGTITVIAVGGSWFFLESFSDHSIMKDFLNYQLRLLTTEDAGHGGPLFYHLPVLLFGCFPASVFAIAGFRRSETDTSLDFHFKRWMIILFLVVLVVFSLVKTKIVHYSSLAWFPISYLAVYSIEKIISGDFKWRKWMSWSIGIILGLVFFSIPFADRYKEAIISSGLIKDEFAIENLKANVHWSGYEILPGAIFIAGIVVVLFLAKNRFYQTAIISLFVLSALVVNSISALIVPKIERYTQGAAIDFYKELQNKDCYVETLGFKSYAHLFYSAKTPGSNANYYNMDWLLTGNIDKPVFFVSKINHAKKFRENYPQLTELYKKNGFVFYERQPQITSYK